MNDMAQCPICGDDCYREEYEFICSNNECMFSWEENPADKKSLHPRRTGAAKKLRKISKEK